MHIYTGLPDTPKMHVYRGTWTGIDLFQPGRYRPDVDAWRLPVPTDTGLVYRPKCFPIRFVNGAAEVDEAMGQLMIEHGIATASPAETAEGALHPARPTPLIPPSEFDDLPDSPFMRIYNAGSGGNGTTIIQPGHHFPDVKGWCQEEKVREGNDTVIRRSYTQFAIKFDGGVAVVTRDVGRYMIRAGLATAWPLASTDPALAQPVA